METGEARRTIERYFELMGQGADFTECYHANVTWLIADTGKLVRGPSPVLDFLRVLHATMVDAQTRRLVVGEANAYLEGDCAATPLEPGSRTYYCVSYDIDDKLITAMRCYGLGARSSS